MEHIHKLLLCPVCEILRSAKSVPSYLKRPYSLLEGLLIGFTDTHNLADCTHLRTELILGALELLKCPARVLDNDVITVGLIIIKSAVLAARNVLKIKACRKHCRNQSDREARCLRSKR